MNYPLISNFAEIQLMVFMINIVVIVSLIRWKWALFNIVLGVSLTALLYNNYINLNLMFFLLKLLMKLNPSNERKNMFANKTLELVNSM